MRVYFKDKKWTVYKVWCITMILSIGILLSGCDKELHNNVEATSAENDFDNDREKVSENSYSDEFILGDSIKAAIEQVALEDKYDDDFLKSEQWKNDFLNSFIYGDFDGYEYKKDLIKKNGVMDKSQIEYVQYSLTGEYIAFDDEPDEVNCTEIKYSPRRSFIITDYDYKKNGDRIMLKAHADESRKGKAETNQYVLNVTLKTNKDSCFDGYSIVNFEKEKITKIQEADNEEHVITWYCSGDDVVDNVITGEFYEADDSLSYDDHVSVIVSDEQKKYVLENVPGEFMVTYDFTNDMSYPISSIKASTIDVCE